MSPVSFTEASLCLVAPRPYLGDTAGMEGRLPKFDTRQDSNPVRRDSEKSLTEDGAIKPAVMGAPSESSTPRVTITPRGSEAPSLPTNMCDMTKSLAKSFGVYAKGIVNTTQSLSQHKAAKTRLRRSHKADIKWQGRYGDFAALEEMQSKNLVSSEKKSSKCEKALDAVRKSHKHATTQIASILAQSAHSTPPSRSGELQGAKIATEVESSSLTIERIKADMTRLRGDFEKLATHAQRADFIVGKQKRLEDEFDELKTRLGKQTNMLEDEMHEIQTDVRDKVSFSAVRAYDQDSAKLKLLVSKAEAIMAKLETRDERAEAINKDSDTAWFHNRIERLQSKIGLLETTRLDDRVQALESKTETFELNKSDVEKVRVDNEAFGKDLKDQIADLQALKTISETTDIQFTELKKELSQQTGDIRSIKEVVFGDDDSNEASLLDIIKDSQNDAQKFRNMFNTLNIELDEHQLRIDDLKTLFQGFKKNLPTSSSNPTIADGDLEGALADIDQLKLDIVRFNEEQELKDDIVSKEVSRVDNQVIRQADILERLCDKVNEVEARNAIHEDEPPSRRQSSQQIHQRLDKLEERVVQQGDTNLRNLEDTNALKLQVHDLSKGMDTHHLPDDVQNLYGLLTQQSGLITDAIAKVDTLWSRAYISHSGTQSPRVPDGIVGANGVDVLKIEALESEHKAIKREVDGLQSKFELFKESTTDTTSNHETFIDSLRQRFDNLTTEHMIRNMIYHMQLIWPNHPTNVQNQLTHFHQRQTQIEHDVGKALAQLRDLDAKTEAQRHQIVLRTTEQSNLLEQARKEFQQRIAELHTLRQQASEDFQRRNTEQISLIEQSKENSQRQDAEKLNLIEKAVADFHLQHEEQSRLLEESKQDFQQRNKVLSEETQEKYTILEQDIRNHLGRIQNLQKGLQSIRTDHTTSVTDLWKTLKDVQVIIQKLEPTHTNGTTDAIELEPLRLSLETAQKRLDDVWVNFLHEMATTHSTLAAVNKNIEALNEFCGIKGNTSPATSHPGTTVTTPFRNANETNIINLEDEEIATPSHNLKAPFDSLGSSPTHQLVVRGGSVSLGQPSSPPEPVPASHEPTPKQGDGASSDSEPVALARTRKRRRGRPPAKGSTENSPRGRKSARIS